MKESVERRQGEEGDPRPSAEKILIKSRSFCAGREERPAGIYTCDPTLPAADRIPRVIQHRRERRRKREREKRIERGSKRDRERRRDADGISGGQCQSAP